MLAKMSYIWSTSATSGQAIIFRLEAFLIPNARSAIERADFVYGVSDSHLLAPRTSQNPSPYGAMHVFV